MTTRKLADHWTREAKKLGYPARSVFKLKEIDAQHRMLFPGARVLDLGCSPGSWTLYAAKQVTPRGFVLGLDLKPVDIILPSHAQVLEQDIFTWRPHPDLADSFDLLLSDMAPSTTGVREMDEEQSLLLCKHALHLAHYLVRPLGAVVLKLFTGRSTRAFTDEFDRSFMYSKSFKPKSSRSESMEIFLIGKQLKKT